MSKTNDILDALIAQLATVTALGGRIYKLDVARSMLSEDLTFPLVNIAHAGEKIEVRSVDRSVYKRTIEIALFSKDFDNETLLFEVKKALTPKSTIELSALAKEVSIDEISYSYPTDGSGIYRISIDLSVTYAEIYK